MTFIGTLIIILLIMLSLTPVFKKSANDIEEIEEPPKDIIQNTDIKLGANTLIDGTGARIMENDVFIEEKGTYTLTGTLINGSIIIDTEDKVILKLKGVKIESEKEGIVINKANTDIYLENGFENYITDGVNNKYNGTIYSDSIVTIYGPGSLFVTGNRGGIIANKLILKGGDIIASGLNYMIEPDESESSQLSLLFNLNDSIERQNNISLWNENNEKIMDFTAAKSVKTILVSSAKIVNGNYLLYKNRTEQSEGEAIIIDNLQNYRALEKNNWFGNSLNT